MEVVNADRVLDRCVAEIVRGAVGEALLDSAAGEHERKALDVMVAAAAPLRHRRPPEFAAPDDQRVVQHAALLEVRDQRRGGLVHFFGLEHQVVPDITVMIPVAMVQLNESHAPLRQPPREEAIRRKRSIAGLRTVHLQDVLRFVAHVEQSRNARLHPERHLVLRDAGLNFRIVQRSILERVQCVDRLNRVELHVAAHTTRVRDVEHRIADRVEAHALKFARQDSSRPLTCGNRLHLTAVALRHEDDESGEVVGLGAQPVQDPRAHARTARDDGSAVHERVRRVVVDLLGPHRPHDARFVDDAADVREQVADQLPRLSELLEAVRRPEAGQLLSLELGNLLSSGERLRHRLAAHVGELRLVVERLEVRRPAGLIQKDDALRLRRKVERVHDAVRLRRRRLRRREQARAEQ